MNGKGRPVGDDEAAYRARFGERLREARTRRRVSQERAAEWVGLSRASIINIEAGRQGFRPFDIIALADNLGVDPGWLLTGRGKQNP